MYKLIIKISQFATCTASNNPKIFQARVLFFLVFTHIHNLWTYNVFTIFNVLLSVFNPKISFICSFWSHLITLEIWWLVFNFDFIWHYDYIRIGNFAIPRDFTGINLNVLLLLIFLLMCLRLPLYSLNLHHDLIRQLIYTFGNALINYGLARRLIIFIIVYFAIPSPLNTRNLFSASLDCVTSLHSPLPRLLLLLSVVHLSKFIEHARDELYLILNRLNLDSFLTWHIEVSFVLNDL